MRNIRHSLCIILLFWIMQICSAQTPANDPTWKKNTALSDDFTTLDCSGGGVYYLTNFTTPSWSVVNNTGWHVISAAPYANHSEGVTSLGLNGTSLYAGTSNPVNGYGGAYKSISGGAWSQLPNLPGAQNFATCFAFNGTDVYVGMEGCVNHFNGSTWTKMTPNSVINNNDVTCLTTNGSSLFAGIYGTSGGVFLYNGTSWSAVNTGLTNTMVTSLFFISGSSLVAGTDGGGVFYSSNNGSNWTSINNGLANVKVTSLTMDGTTLIAGTDGGVFYSSNYSTITPSWTSANAAGLTNTYVTSLARITTGAIVAGTSGGGVFYSTNYSSGSPSWTAINGTGTGLLPSLTISSLIYDGSSKLYVGVCPKWRVQDWCNNYDGAGANFTPAAVSTTFDASVGSNVLDLQDMNTQSCSRTPVANDAGAIETFNAKYRYGYYETYAKTPYTTSSPASPWDAFHPSFWTYYHVYDGSCNLSHQEIDIFEPGPNEYMGTTNGYGYWHDQPSCSPNLKTIAGLNTYSGYLYSAYHKYAVEWGPNKMIYYFDDAPFSETYNQSDLVIEGLHKVVIAAGLDYGIPYASGDVLPAHYKTDYFNYYQLDVSGCVSNASINNGTDFTNYFNITTPTLPGPPTVHANITIGTGSSSISLGSTDQRYFRASNSIIIYGDFSVPAGAELGLIPTPCN